MVKCPFCQFDNEEGALFCEQCKSDLASVPSAPAPAPPPPAMPEPVPMAAIMEDNTIPMAPIVEAFPMAPIMGLEPTIPVAAVMDAPPVAAVAPPPPASIPAPPPAAVASSAPAAPPTSAPAPTMPPPVAEAPPAPTTPAAPAAGGKLPDGAQPKLVVIRGQKLKQEFPVYEGHNFIGRADEKPVDIDLEDQEPPDRIWTSRQHALITFEEGALMVEDLNSANGTFVNRARIYPGQKRNLSPNDVIQIGTVQMKVTV